jgi:hypothetical protein
MNDPQTVPELPEPWERQSGEPSRWYARFDIFRLAGPSRSLLAAVNAEREQRGAQKSKSIPQAWAKSAKEWRWRERAEAWDERQRQQARAAHEKEIEEMNRRHLQEAKALQSKAIQRLKALEHAQLSPADLLRFFTEGTKLERTALGEPQTIEENRLTGPGGGAVIFTVEDAVNADRQLEEWSNDRLQSQPGTTVPDGDSQEP